MTRKMNSRQKITMMKNKRRKKLNNSNLNKLALKLLDGNKLRYLNKIRKKYSSQVRATICVIVLGAEEAIFLIDSNTIYRFVVNYQNLCLILISRKILIEQTI